jgi:beta-lactamase class A
MLFLFDESEDHMRKPFIIAALMAGCVHEPLPLSELEQLERQTGGRIGVAALDLESGGRIRYRADERFPFCSTFKTMAVAAALRSGDLTKRLAFTRDEVESAGYAPITTQFVDKGMTIAELSAAAIQYSDNAAVNILIKDMGGLKAVNDFARDIDDQIFHLDRWEPELNSAEPFDTRDTTSPDAMTESVRKILLGEILAPRQRELLVLWHKTNTTGDKRIRAGTPPQWTVGDKTGTCSFGTTNDIGVLWKPNGSAVVVSIYFTQAVKDAQPLEAAVAQAARIISNTFKAQ